MNCQICFFNAVAMKIAVLVSWRTIPVSPCLSTDLKLQIQKRCSYLKNVALDFVFFGCACYSYLIC